MTTVLPTGGDDSPAFAAAFAGGIVETVPGGKYLIDTDLTIPKGCAIRGPFIRPGHNQMFVDPVGAFGSIAVNPAATIKLEDAAGLSGLIIHRQGLVGIEPDSSAFAGTAITLIGTDAFVRDCMIIGFDKCILSAGVQRPRLSNLNIDGNNGIEISGCADIAYLENIHAWPFATSGNAHDDRRTGNGFYFHDVCDWGKVTNCFAYGYLNGFRLHNVNSMTLLSCGADNTKTDGVPNHDNSTGAYISGASYDTRLIGFQSAAHKYAGIRLSMNAGCVAQISSSDIWKVTSHGIAVHGGDAVLTGNMIRNVANGLTATAPASRITRSANRFKTCGASLNITPGVTMIGGWDDVS